MTVKALLVSCALLLAAPAPSLARTVATPRAARLTLVGGARTDLAGASVAAAGDVNGDGRPDTVIGAPLADPLGRRDAGAAYVVFGDPRGRLSLANLNGHGFAILGATPLPAGARHPGATPFTSGAGATVAGLGDVNGDGLADLAVSGRVPGGGFGGTSSVVFVVFGKRDAAPVDLASLGSGGFVIRVDDVDLRITDGLAVGDVDGDGLADVGVRVSEDMGEDAGYVVLVPGRTGTTPVAIDTLPAIVGGTAGMELGGGLAPAGDVNGDGFGDILLGAPGARSERGVVFVLYGGVAPMSARILPGRRFGGFEVDAPRHAHGFGYALARLWRGFVAGAPGAPLNGLHGAGAWIVPSRTAHPRRLAPTRYGRPIGIAVAATTRGDALVAGRERALLYSRRGRLLITYRGLRPGRETRIAVAAAGRDLILGSPGTSRVYVVAG